MPTDRPDSTQVDASGHEVDDVTVVEWEGDEFDVAPDDEDGGYEGRRERRKGVGFMLGTMMMGLREVFEPRVKPDDVIEIESSGDPPDIDRDGLHEAVGTAHRMDGPPLARIKAAGRRPTKTRRPASR